MIVTNQITTRIVSNGTFTASHGCLVPALGDSWGHICSVRILLSKGDGTTGDRRRTAKLLKHPGRPPGIATYQVTVCLSVLALYNFLSCPTLEFANDIVVKVVHVKYYFSFSLDRRNSRLSLALHRSIVCTELLFIVIHLFCQWVTFLLICFLIFF